MGSDTEDMELGKQQEKEAGAGTPGNMFQMMNQIQSLIKMTVEKAKQEEKNNSNQKCEYVCTIWKSSFLVADQLYYECC